jgi:hypothetical protein
MGTLSLAAHESFNRATAGGFLDSNESKQHTRHTMAIPSRRISQAAIYLIAMSCFSGAVSAQTKNEKPIEVDYCTLIKSADKYDEKRVSFKALMVHSTVGRVDGGDEFLYAKDCNNEDAFTVTDYSDAKEENFNKVYRFMKRLKRERNFILEVTISGRFETAKTALFGHLGWTLHQLMVDDVASIIDVTGRPDYTKPDWKAPTIITGEQSRILRTNSAVIRYLSGSTTLPTVDNINGKVKLISPNARELSLEQLSDLRKDFSIDLIQPFEVTVMQVKYEKERYVIWGAYIAGKDKNKKVFTYETTYLRTGDNFQLESATFYSQKAV